MLLCTKLFILSISDIFFTAYSDAKLILFLIALGIFLLLNKVMATHSAKMKRYQPFIILSIYILLTILFAAGAWIYWYACQRFGIPWNRVAILADQEVFSTFTGAFHNHVFKPIATWILLPLGLGGIQHYGTGLPFFTLMPEMQWFYISMSVLLLLLVILMIYVGITMSHKHKGVWFSLAYTVFSYGLLKSIVDGGILWYEAHLYLLFYTILLLTHTKRIHIALPQCILFILGMVTYSQITHIIMRVMVEHMITKDMIFGQFVVIYALGCVSLALWFMVVNKKKQLFYPILLCIAALCLHQTTQTAIQFQTACIPHINKQKVCSPLILTKKILSINGSINTVIPDASGNITHFTIINTEGAHITVQYELQPCAVSNTNEVLVKYLHTLGLQHYILL